MMGNLNDTLETKYNRLVIELAESKRREIELRSDFDRRTDILNNHIAREKVLGDALDKASNVFGQVAECVLRSGGSVPKEDLMEIYRVCAEQALAAKEPANRGLPSRMERSAAGRAAGCVGAGPAEHPTGCGCHLAAKEPTV